MDYNLFLCVIFIISLLSHFTVMSMISIDNAYYLYDDMDYRNNSYLCNYKGSIILPTVDIRYVFAMMMLVITQQHTIMCILSAIIFANSYLKYMGKSYKNIYAFNPDIALTLFLCFWISVYYIIIPDKFVSYLMLLGSGCIIGI